MSLAKTHGVVIRRMNLGEADRLLTIFTKQFGKIKAISKGSRKPRSRHAGHSELLCVAEFMLWRREGRDLGLVRGAELLERSCFLSEDMRAFTAAQFAADLIDSSLVENDPQAVLYAELIRFLRALKHAGNAMPALLVFCVRAADILGYRLSISRCAECHVREITSGPAWLEYSVGGLLCEKCAETDLRSGEQLDRDAVSAIRLASARPPRVSGEEAAAAAVRAIDRMLSFHQDRRALASARFLGLMPAAGAPG